MAALINIVLPVFGLIVIGYGMARTPLLSPEGIRGLNSFIFYVAIPALLFRTLSRGIDLEASALALVAGYFGAHLVLYALTALAGRALFAFALPDQGLMALSATFSNTVMMGIPLIYTAFGDAGMLPMLTIVTFHSIILLSLATVVIEVGRGGAAGSMVLASLGGLLRNPVIVAMIVGIGYGLTGRGLAAPVERLIGLLAAAAPPCALFALGASLTQFRIAGDLRLSGLVVALKLLALPALVWLACSFVFVLPPLWTAVATVSAALPTGANVFVLASRYDRFVGPSAAITVLSTALSLLTLAALLSRLVPTA